VAAPLGVGRYRFNTNPPSGHYRRHLAITTPAFSSWLDVPAGALQALHCQSGHLVEEEDRWHMSC